MTAMINTSRSGTSADNRPATVPMISRSARSAGSGADERLVPPPTSLRSAGRYQQRQHCHHQKNSDEMFHLLTSEMGSLLYGKRRRLGYTLFKIDSAVPSKTRCFSLSVISNSSIDDTARSIDPSRCG